MPTPSEKTEEEKKDEEEEFEEEDAEEENGDAEEEEKPKKKKKIRFIKSKMIGGAGGDAFDDGNHRKVVKITAWSDAILRGVKMGYENGDTDLHGNEDGKMHEIELPEGQYINKVGIVANDEIVLKVTFWTNTGDEVGRFGREGGRMMKDKKGEETILTAPRNMQLCGLFGTAGSLIDGLGCRWGSLRK